MSTDPTTPSEKTCFKCGQAKPRSEFYKHPQMADGLLGKCKSCAKSDVQANYQDKHAEKRAYDKKRDDSEHRRATRRKSGIVRRELHPEKFAARTAVHNALRDGRLIRKDCEVCGDPKTQGHHPDYSKPLDVKWLCFTCHRREHGQRVAGDPPKPKASP